MMGHFALLIKWNQPSRLCHCGSYKRAMDFIIQQSGRDDLSKNEFDFLQRCGSLLTDDGTWYIITPED